MTLELPDARELSDEALDTLRLRAIRGVELGYTEVELANLLGLRHETISRWWRAYQTAGIDSLPGERTGRPLGSGRFLDDVQSQRIQHIIDNQLPHHHDLSHPLWTRRAVGDLIRKEFDIDLADRTVGTYLRRWGYSSKKPSRRSVKQDPDEVEQWLIETYPSIENQARLEQADIFWTDEVGVQADHHPASGYARVGEGATLETPPPHLRVNQISAISNDGMVQFMIYQGMLTAAVFLTFLVKLIEAAPRKILLIADNLPAHKTPEVLAWIAEHKEQIEIYYLPTYAPEFNPVEYLNNDLKGRVNAEGMASDRPTLQSRVEEFMRRLTSMPSHVISYFLHHWTKYAAPVELI